MLKIVFTVTPKAKGSRVSYAAAAPAELRSSFSGSGMPFASERQALEDTPNRGVAEQCENGTYTVRIREPNSYYVALGTALVPPALHVLYASDEDGRRLHGAAKVAEPIPFRTLTYQALRSGAGFYKQGIAPDVRSQPDILTASEFPRQQQQKKQPRCAAEFWGGRPPV